MNIEAGTKCNRLEFLYEGPPDYSSGGIKMRTCWVKCDCGTIKKIRFVAFLYGGTKSCGCLKLEIVSEMGRRLGPANGKAKGPENGKRNKTHGQSFLNKKPTPEYKAWGGMKDRCFNPKIHNFEYYGGRGITVCKEWVDNFQSFYDYIGPKPGPEYSLDRIDVDGNYEPGNVRWATWSEQNLNKQFHKKKRRS